MFAMCYRINDLQQLTFSSSSSRRCCVAGAAHCCGVWQSYHFAAKRGHPLMVNAYGGFVRVVPVEQT